MLLPLLSTLTLGAEPVDPVATLLGQALTSDEAWAELVELCDDIGPRLSGSDNLVRAIDWSAAKMAEDGLDVTRQPVDIPVWIRGEESGRLLEPVAERLEVLGLGRSVSTPKKGIEAEVIAARNWEELEGLGDSVAGKIVLFDPEWNGYGKTVQYRSRGADAAAKAGAVAVLLRSVTHLSLHTTHTGAMGYDGTVQKIPAAAVTVEAAARMRRWLDRGRTVRVALTIRSETGPDAPSANVIGEVKGAEKPDEVVLLGCHLDSWDVGTGAQDDGAACVAAMEAGALIAALPNKPRRTVRVVLFTNEENGLRGGKAYNEVYGAQTHIAMIESDTGMSGTLGFRVDTGRALDGDDRGEAQAAAIASLRPLTQVLAPLGSDQLTAGYAGADVGPTLARHGWLGLGVMHEMEPYWRIHHTHADTIDKIDPSDLKKEVATLAAMAWQLANVEAPPVAQSKPEPEE